MGSPNEIQDVEFWRISAKLRQQCVRLSAMVRLVIEDMSQRRCKWLMGEMIASSEVRVIEVSGDIGISQIGDNTFDACVFALPGSSKFFEIFK